MNLPLKETVGFLLNLPLKRTNVFSFASAIDLPLKKQFEIKFEIVKKIYK
jgi:hypothetical protein